MANNRFEPLGFLTRGQAATVIHRLINPSIRKPIDINSENIFYFSKEKFAGINGYDVFYAPIVNNKPVTELIDYLKFIDKKAEEVYGYIKTVEPIDFKAAFDRYEWVEKYANYSDKDFHDVFRYNDEKTLDATIRARATIPKLIEAGPMFFGQSLSYVDGMPKTKMSFSTDFLEYKRLDKIFIEKQDLSTIKLKYVAYHDIQLKGFDDGDKLLTYQFSLYNGRDLFSYKPHIEFIEASLEYLLGKEYEQIFNIVKKQMKEKPSYNYSFNTFDINNRTVNVFIYNSGNIEIYISLKK